MKKYLASQLFESNGSVLYSRRTICCLSIQRMRRIDIMDVPGRIVLRSLVAIYDVQCRKNVGAVQNSSTSLHSRINHSSKQQWAHQRPRQLVQLQDRQLASTQPVFLQPAHYKVRNHPILREHRRKLKPDLVRPFIPRYKPARLGMKVRAYVYVNY